MIFRMGNAECSEKPIIIDRFCISYLKATYCYIMKKCYELAKRHFGGE